MTFQTILVTGANRGIGLRLIIDLLKLNPKHIIATARDVSKAKELNELASKNSNLHIVQLEMTDYTRYDSLVAEVEKIVGDLGLQFLVQNAGIAIWDNVDSILPENLVKVYEVNAVAPILLTRKFLPLLRKSRSAGNRTVAAFMSSDLGSIELKIIPQIFAYPMSKSALNQGARSLALQYKDDLIDFVILHPGHVQTDMGTNHGKIEAPVTPEESVQGMLKQLDNLELVKDGRVITWEGKLLPW